MSLDGSTTQMLSSFWGRAQSSSPISSSQVNSVSSPWSKEWVYWGTLNQRQDCEGQVQGEGILHVGTNLNNELIRE